MQTTAWSKWETYGRARRPNLEPFGAKEVDLLDFVAWLADSGRVSMRNKVPGYKPVRAQTWLGPVVLP